MNGNWWNPIHRADSRRTTCIRPKENHMYKTQKGALLAGGLCAVLATAGCAAGAAPGSSADKQVTIRLSHSIHATDPIGLGAERFKQLVEKNSNGSIKVQIYPNNQLGGENQVLAQLKQGSIQMAITAAGTMGNLVPDISVMDAPYLWKDWPAEAKVLSGPVGKHFQKEFADTQGIQLLSASWYYGLRDLTANKAIRTPADAVGLKIRTPPAPVNLLSADVLGGKGIPMDFSLVYLALKSGTLDAEENPLQQILTSKLYEVQKYVILTKHIQQSQVVSMNLAFWKGLSSNQQKVVQAAVDDAGKYETTLAQQVEKTAQQSLSKEPGVTIITNPDIAAFRARARQLDPQLKGKWGGLYDQILSAQG